MRPQIRLLLATLLLLLAACGAPSQPGSGSNTQPTSAVQQPARPTSQPADQPKTGPTAAPADQPTQPTQPTQPPAGQPARPRQTITLAEPGTGAAVRSPIQLSGHAAIWPFEGGLRARVYDANGNLLAEGPLQVPGGPDGPGDFSGEIAVTGYSGPATVEVADMSAEDGSLIAQASASVVIESTQNAHDNSITVEQPNAGASVAGSVRVSGSVKRTPFEANLRGQVLDRSGRVLGEGPVQVLGELGQPGTFDAEVPIDPGFSGEALVTVAELSANDGSVLAMTTVNINVTASPGGSELRCAARRETLPRSGEVVTMPVHVQMYFDQQPGEQVTVRLRWNDGTELTQNFSLLDAGDGCGLLIGSVDWMTESEPPQPSDRAVMLEVLDASGRSITSDQINVLRWDDPETQELKLFWLLGEQLQQATLRVPKTQALGRAALEQLLWGPRPGNLAGFETALPTPEEVLSFPGRGPDWGPRVQLRKLTIENGVATADFSRELTAAAGGATRVQLIRAQIEQTLRQFSSVQEVRITVEGQDSEMILQP